MLNVFRLMRCGQRFVASDSSLTKLWPYTQEVKAAAAEALKEMGAYEKQEVGLEEKCKHANSKAKKLKKSFQDVSPFGDLLLNIVSAQLDCLRMRTLAMTRSVPFKRTRQR